ncbi:concanavalin A-like lectin/glucanase domain-containing protein [Globomyces pollinis-pini]|nr:concanavalin A-like lectin/glucanase domain-containing protein [Globomyces pollinis-pini]
MHYSNRKHNHYAAKEESDDKDDEDGDDDDDWMVYKGKHGKDKPKKDEDKPKKDKPKKDKPKKDKPKKDKPKKDKPKKDKPKKDKPKGDKPKEDKPKKDKPEKDDGNRGEGKCNPNGKLLFRTDFSKGLGDGYYREDVVANGEIQSYPNNPENIFTKGKKLHIKAIKKDGKWTSARIRTKQGWKNFRAEIKFRLDKASDGAFPAIWMLPQEEGKNFNWPLHGEIDIFEYNTGFGGGSHTPQSLHFQDFHAANAKGFPNCKMDVTKWNKVAVEVTDKVIRFYCNGKFNNQYSAPNNFATNSWPYDQNPFGFVFNYAIQPGFSKPVPNDVRSLEMIIAYAKVTAC